jgi:predicted SAM-dependent methyltransferase
MRGLNLGCGSRFHPDWVNIDAVSLNVQVLAHDLNKGIPFPDSSFDVLYHSHLLEHFKKESALDFLQECYRVLRTSGIIRVVVPDLEQIARIYLRALEKSLQGHEEWQHHYNWMMLELYDQAVRVRTGGDMLDYLRQQPIPNEKFVFQRIGSEARAMLQSIRESNSIGRDRRKIARNSLVRIRTILRTVRVKFLRMSLSQEDYRALEVGQFRASGEIHQWMYDRYSLARILKEAGFKNPRAVGASASQIPAWTEYNLDTEIDGRVCKPDSLFMEASKF